MMTRKEKWQLRLRCGLETAHVVCILAFATWIPTVLVLLLVDVGPYPLLANIIAVWFYASFVGITTLDMLAAAVCPHQLWMRDYYQTSQT